jgi:hypothetical protein
MLAFVNPLGSTAFVTERASLSEISSEFGSSQILCWGSTPSALCRAFDRFMARKNRLVSMHPSPSTALAELDALKANFDSSLASHTGRDQRPANEHLYALQDALV